MLSATPVMSSSAMFVMGQLYFLGKGQVSAKTPHSMYDAAVIHPPDKRRSG
jgi:hypothetical protein